METLRVPSIGPELGVRASKAAPILVATDGRSQSDGALCIGRLLADDDDALKVLSVVAPLPIIPESTMVVNESLARSGREDRVRDVAAQVDRLIGRFDRYEVVDGEPASAIAKAAHASNASMIVCGLGRHRVSDRIFGDETALRLMRQADVPVFAVTERVTQVPTRIVVAVDFSETSFRAARTAIEVASTNATIYLVHVAPRGVRNESNDWSHSYRAEAQDALLALREQLRPAPDMVLDDVLLEGDPSIELLSFATGVHADLIATGSHGRGFVTRMLIGSVATRIVRGAGCSVLTVPRSAVMTEAGIAFPH